MDRAQVLIVDDDANMILLLKYNLEKRGYAVSSAADGEIALQMAKDRAFDLLLLDVMLPGISGLDICRQLRAEDRYRETPILIMTARAQMDDLETAAQCGASAYVTKPFDPIRLVDKVDAQLAAVHAQTGRGVGE